ncbi:protein RD3-like isoform X1 [Pseudoliparis swirei]|uniref:protein RD3-like isoform X1 n=1 Tax=Pseudoliparis swirei TaxID=2059687 RepID=UPI0024BE7ED0|nr:protein RD3-like isoform X1 [Pseudoliparis swirei]
MPLFSWMKWSHETKAQARDEAAPPKTSVVVPGRVSIGELLWHVEERERSVRELDREHRLTRGALGLHWFQKYPRLQTLIPTSERHQLEFLCAQIPPVDAASVLSRFREVLATNNVKPWELAFVFKQVLRDFLSQKEHEEENFSVQAAELRPMDAWTSCSTMKQGFATPIVPNCGDNPREEIPTISGYVDRVMRHSGSISGSNRDWDLPVPLRATGTHSTTL